MGQLKQGTFSNAVVEVNNAGEVVAVKNGPRTTPYNPPVATQNDRTGSRAFGTAYQNTSGRVRLVYGYGSTTGSAWVELTAKTGAGSPTDTVWSNQVGATTTGQSAGFYFAVLPNAFYQVDASGSGATTLQKWWEMDI